MVLDRHGNHDGRTREERQGRPHLLSVLKSWMTGVRIETHSTGAVWLLMNIDSSSPWVFECIG